MWSNFLFVFFLHVLAGFACLLVMYGLVKDVIVFKSVVRMFNKNVCIFNMLANVHVSGHQYLSLVFHHVEWRWAINVGLEFRYLMPIVEVI